MVYVDEAGVYLTGSKMINTGISVRRLGASVSLRVPTRACEEI